MIAAAQEVAWGLSISERLSSGAAWSAIAGKLPDALVFHSIPHRWAAQEQHDQACKVRKVLDYTMRDACHCWAVRMARAGVAIEQISKQLRS